MDILIKLPVAVTWVVLLVSAVIALEKRITRLADERRQLSIP